MFSEWMKFIECRKAVVSAFHLPTRTSVYGDSIGRDSELFIQHFSKLMQHQQPNAREICDRYSMCVTYLYLYYWHSQPHRNYGLGKIVSHVYTVGPLWSGTVHGLRNATVNKTQTKLPPIHLSWTFNVQIWFSLIVFRVSKLTF